MNVAITGMGVASALGHDPAELYDRLCAKEVAIRETPWTRDDPERFEWWAPVETRPPAWMDARKLDGIDPFAQNAGFAVTEALAHAGIGELDPLRTGIFVGTAKNGTQSMERAQFDVDRAGRETASGKYQIRVWPNLAASQIAMNWGLHGPTLTISTACASSLDAIGLGARFIASGQIDVALVGGAEGGLSWRIGEDGYVPASAYSRSNYGMGANVDDPTKACRPFDVDRGGMVFGEGAGMFVLESEEHARRRGARPLGWVQGWGSAADAYHPSTPDPTGQWERLAMEHALADAGVSPEVIDAVAAHGTGTAKGDVAEINAINDLYGARVGEVSVMSVKGTLGHPTGAAGAIALVTALEGMKRDEVIFTGGTSTPDPLIRFDLVLDEPRRRTVDWLQVNAFGFGGQNASLVVSREAQEA
ncbi:beta-ketoacyl-[acyl-carrier-protein] synthase family protein [Microbacterium sp. No. 7]|uniref:beta-ketoacyl-[acyl-carrier-protein] synthase family protein n=1 Tax=Microbacterium sp. No. 7 TaxID=1714373 RepID=UPI0006D0979A|nr:beta-ketoacyl-[acyl-carrier-protein] synthase family protein [Microbacterium sp. No. 7]ALJ21850.1 hypothetical protein AOA12_18890 [Microbacterium sp. No. 7]